MSHVYIALGKSGDILSVAPIVQMQARLTGKPQSLMVSEEFVYLVNRLEGIIPVPYNGTFFDLMDAIRQAKRKYDQVIPLQVFDRTVPISHRTPSFQLDQWLRAGRVDSFQDCGWQLHVPRPKTCSFNSGNPLVIFADFSQSSPFKHKEELYLLIRDALPGHKIVRTSEYRLSNICDFLPMYDAADLIVSVDTAHLHLTRACQTPVVAMIQDQPTRWHGSAWHPRFRLHCRYGDFEARQGELIAAMQKASPIKLEKQETALPNGYNPSFIDFNGSRIMTYRWHRNGDWRTRIAVDSKEIVFPKQYDDYSIEDGRLFTLAGKLMLSYVVARFEHGVQSAIVGYGELVNDGGWRIVNHHQPKFGRNEWTGIEKNWTPFEYKGQLRFIYASFPHQIVLEVDGDRVVKAHKSGGVSWEYGDVRGGCIVPHGTKLLRFFHSHTTRGPRESWIYRIGAALMNPEPPFETIQVSSAPIIAGNEKWIPCRHWKQNVAFPGGAIATADGWKLAVGWNDCECVTVDLRESDLNL